jgi:lysophospholipase L1-like esterase
VYGMVPKESFSSKSVDQRLKQSSNVGNFDKVVTFNRLGYRGKEFAIEKPKSTLRIVAFGGSTTLGLENDDPDTWPAQLEAMLERDRQFLEAHQVEHVEVINAGVGGWRTREGLLRLEREVTQFAPDMILVAFNWNDFIDGLNGIDPEAVKSEEKRWWHHSVIAQNLRIRFLQWKYGNEKLYEEWTQSLRRDQPWAKVFKRNIVSMGSIARQMGADFVLINLPGLCRETDVLGEEYRLIVTGTRVKPANFAFYTKLKEHVGVFLYEIGAEMNVEVINVEEDFHVFKGKDRTALFTDEMHTTALGSREIAKSVHRGLLKLLQQPQYGQRTRSGADRDWRGADATFAGKH